VSTPAEVPLIALGGTGWYLWQESELRTAGFPAAMVAALGDDQLAGAGWAGGGRDSEQFATAYEKAAARQAARLREVAGHPRLREAVAWQNPDMLDRCVDKVATGSPAKGSVHRRRELKVASYLQRYALKNDTIGFFGPVGWARWSGLPLAVQARAGDELVTQRRVYFEQWAIDAVAEALCRELPLLPWCVPTPAGPHLVAGGLARRPRGAPVPLSPAQVRVLGLCDGRRSAREICALIEPTEQERDGCPDGYGLLGELRDLQLITMDFTQSIVDEPELRLRTALCTVDDRAIGSRALAGVDELIADRDAVAGAAGDADKLRTALERLDATFQRLTGQDATRRGGEAYAGRRLVYEDTVRDLTVELGQPLLDALAPPLGLLLDSARWLVGTVAEAYRRRFVELFEACRARAGTAEVPFATLLAAATPDLAFSFRDLPGPVADQVPELQRRWASILDVPAGARRHQVCSARIADRVRQAFPAAAAPWSSAVHYCPDVMVAADSIAAVNRGDYDFVLGELHLARNTLDCRVIHQQHPDPVRLLASDARDRGGMRVVPVPARASEQVNSRTYPPALLRPEYLYWTLHTPHTGAPGPIVPGAGMMVYRVGDDLAVRMPHDGRSWDLLEVLGEYLSAAVMNGFSPVPTGTHRPRIAIDRLVISREAWSFPIDELPWAFVTDRARRYQAARDWQRRNELPGRGFYRVASEDKPVFLDFSSIVLVDLLATGIRAAVEQDGDSRLSLTEMLPDLGQQWVRDSQDAGYTAELRLVVVDPSRLIHR
jgi:hypothetical protein